MYSTCSSVNFLCHLSALLYGLRGCIHRQTYSLALIESTQGQI